MKRIFAGFVVCLFIVSTFLLPLSVAAEDLTSTQTDFDTSVKVYDYADLLDVSEEASLSATAQEIAERQQMDIAIVTILDAEGKSSKNYANEFYDNNGFGYGNENSGLLMLLNMEVREVWVSTTGEAIRLFTDSDIDTLLDAVYTYLSSADYAGACTTFLEASDEHITISRLHAEDSGGGTANVDTDSGEGITTVEISSGTYRGDRHIPFREQYSVPQIVSASVGIGFSIALIVTLCILWAHKRSLAPTPGAQAYLGGKGLVLTRQEDRFMHTHTTRTAIPKNDSNSGGSSSGGTSHGGGGRSF